MVASKSSKKKSARENEFAKKLLLLLLEVSANRATGPVLLVRTTIIISASFAKSVTQASLGKRPL
jgi:hypothetical protein